MRQLILLTGVILICMILFLKSFKSGAIEQYDGSSNSIFKSEIGLLINPPKEGFLDIPKTNPTKADIKAHEELIVKLNVLKAQIDDIPHQDKLCSYAYKPIMNVLNMLEPDYELDNKIKNDMARFLLTYFSKVIHLNEQVHGLTNLCDMVPSENEGKAEKEYIMEKLLDMLKLVIEIAHLKQNKRNNIETSRAIRETRADIYKQYKNKIKAITDNHNKNLTAQIRKLRSPFKGRFKRF